MIKVKNVAAIAVIILIIALYSCQNSQEARELVESKKILKIHNQQRVNHFQKLINESFSQLSNEFISINRGEISELNEEEFKTNRKGYYDAVEFEKWDDITPPIIRFSDNYKMAYTIVNKEVIVTYKNENNEATRELTEFSWVAIYKKYHEGWKIDCIASTNKPSVVSKMLD